jgi:DNA-binding transcriptional MocR family regulator
MRDSDNRVQLVTLYTRVILHLVENPRISQEMLARRLDVTMRTAQRHLAELEEEGYISVDRGKKPFEYSINWEKTWPYVPWLRVILFHPDVRDAHQKLSDVAFRTYELARLEGRDPSEALQQMHAQEKVEPGVA